MQQYKMFKRKDVFSKPVNTIDGQYIRKGAGVLKAYTDNATEQRQRRSPVFSEKFSHSHKQVTHMSALDISEQYLQAKHGSSASAPNSVKGVRKKLVPFLTRRKKGSVNSDTKSEPGGSIEADDEDAGDIVGYDDLVAEQQSINPVILGQLDDSQIEIEQYVSEEDYNARLQFVLNNYRHPPPYPGKKPQAVIDRFNQRNRPDLVDTPMINQLLQENNKMLTDNASMINYWQAGPSARLSNEDLSSNLPSCKSAQAATSEGTSDRLVLRTRNVVSSTSDSPSPSPQAGNSISAGELFRKRQQYYRENSNLLPPPRSPKPNRLSTPGNIDSLSEMYPRDYTPDTSSRKISLSASVPDLRPHKISSEADDVALSKKAWSRRARMEPGQLEALMVHYRKTSLDHLGPYEMGAGTHDSVSLYSSDESPTYVPPSPYLSAEIPEWLQIYAKASSELDDLLKWDMFRYHELDCWQTMLKRLYKKELEQIVLWFEVYRQSLYQELDERHAKMGIKRVSTNINEYFMRKADV